MGTIIILDGAEVDALRDMLNAYGSDARYARVAIDEDSFKIKLNESVWSPPLGKIDAS